MATAEQRPLTPTSDRISSEEESGAVPPVGRRNHPRMRRAIGIAAAVVLALAIVILALSLTVFKVKDPELTANSVTLSQVRLDLFGGKLNMTVTADVSVKNPNSASFDYGESTTTLSYDGTTIGEATAPGGSSPARQTVRMIVSVNVMADRLLSNGNFFAQVATGSVSLSSLTIVSGRVKVLGAIRPRVRVRMSCDFDVSVMSQSIRNFSCRQSVKF